MSINMAAEVKVRNLSADESATKIVYIARAITKPEPGVHIQDLPMFVGIDENGRRGEYYPEEFAEPHPYVQNVVSQMR